MQELSVRPARAEDAEGVVRAHEASWNAALAPLVGKTLGQLAPLAARVERARATLADPPVDACAWIAEREGVVAGMAVASDAELRDLYVVPAAWGTGAGAELMRAALDWIAARGVQEALLWVGEENLRARRFYEREGWAADGGTRTNPLGPVELRYRRPLQGRGPAVRCPVVPPFKTAAAYRPTGDQPQAIATIAEGLRAADRYQTLLGATGTGKTATMAWIVEEVQKPTLVIAHNKTLAAQLCNEFREFFPDNAVEYFVSYYDYYQPEAYVPQADLYIEKESTQNDDIARLRLAATSALFTRRDVLVVASVSCIYGLGSPEEWRERVLILEVGEEHDRDAALRKLVESQYVRNDTVLGRGRFRVKGDVVEVQPANAETAYRISFFGDEVEQITHFDPITGEVYAKLDNLTIWPATEYVTSRPTIERAVDEIRAELEAQLAKLEREGKMLEAHRLRQRTEYDLEMMKELGFCSGIENYSRILEGRPPGSHPFTLLDYFPDDFLVFVDESHQTVPQIGGMSEGDRSRKQTLVDFGFRLPSALDNRPLRFDEFLGKVPQLVFVSATPGPYELRHSTRIAEQLVRPTGIVDPEVEVRPTRNQIDDLLAEIRRREEMGERVLVTTLTKKMAEDLTDYLLESGVKARYLHSEIDTLERIRIIRELRLGEHDVLVGVNLLREGLDMPEVSLVAILDADKEGFLRGRTSLIQTIGRAARNVNGKVVLYADKMTEAIKEALDETNRRRAVQLAYNEEHGITPETIRKGVSDIAEFLTLEAPHVPSTKRRRGAAKVEGMSRDELEKLVVTLEEEMFAAAEELRFEYAAKLRDEIKALRRDLEAASVSPAASRS